MFKVDYILNAYISGQIYQAPMKNGHNFVEDEEEVAGAMALPIANSNTSEQIQEVLNIFPHLTIDFVEKLLQRYESTEKAIAEYLEGNLPPDLIENDSFPAEVVAQRTPSVSPIPSTSTTRTASDDKFLDQFNFADNSKVIVKMGKGFPGGHRNASALLDDKSHVRSLKDRYESYGLIVENENEYDDEYDDSYDGMTESESKSHRKAVGVSSAKDFVVDEEDEDDGEEEDEEGDDGNQRDKSKDFCENPEAVRERLAKSRYSKFVARGSTKPKPPRFICLNFGKIEIDFERIFIFVPAAMLVEVLKIRAHNRIVTRKIWISQHGPIITDDKVLLSNVTEAWFRHRTV